MSAERILRPSFVRMAKHFGVIVCILIATAALVWGLAHV